MAILQLGRIINVSSVAGLYGYPGLSTYCATKHAMEAVSCVLRHELAKFNIAVVTVQPGDFSKATHLLDNHHRNMNEMWSEMSDLQRNEYKEYFIAYHNGVAKTGITGKRIKPLSVLPKNVISGFEKALLTKVISRKRDADGKVIGKSNSNPILDTRIYQVKFPDGAVAEYSANIIAENILSQVDSDGYTHSFLSEILGHRSTSEAVTVEDGLIHTKSGLKPIITTKGWEIYVKWMIKVHHGFYLRK